VYQKIIRQTYLKHSLEAWVILWGCPAVFSIVSCGVLQFSGITWQLPAANGRMYRYSTFRHSCLIIDKENKVANQPTVSQLVSGLAGRQFLHRAALLRHIGLCVLVLIR